MFDAPAVPEPAWHRQDLRVPRADGTVFARPPLRDAAALAAANHELLSGNTTHLQGRTLEHLRAWSREAVLAAARQYTAELAGSGGEISNFIFQISNGKLEDSGLLFVGGHQPTLFHPGVWVKNFAIGRLAAETGGTSLHLIVDNDTLATTRIRVPQGDRFAPTFETVAFDEDRAAGPWEEAQVVDRELFASFGERVAERMAAWGIEPLARTMWPDAVERLERSPRLSDCLTAARHRLERRWGLSNLELPISRVCTLDPFLWFTGHLLAQLPRFREVHNQVLREYRVINRVRSRTHPVPELKEAGGWHEAPLWMWKAGDHRRGRVLAKQVGREVRLSDGREEFARLKLSPEMDACCAVEGLRELPARGIRLRTRALTTTLFARLCLADLFVHGIGGAKYDEMTDRIIARFYGLPIPAFQTLSATRHLPLAEPHDVRRADEERLVGLLRDLEHNPDRHLTPGFDARVDALAGEKRALIEAESAAAASGQPGLTRRRRVRENHERLRRFRAVNRDLAAATAAQRVGVAEELESVRQRLQANAALQSREYSFCLYPEETLRPFLSDLKV